MLEGSPSLGGKIGAVRVAGVEVDSGAESLLARRPEALALIDEVGLGEEIVHPQTAQAAVWSRGVLHRLPAGTMMGIPSEVDSLSPLLSPAEIARVAAESLPSTTPPGTDISIGDFVAERLGDAVVDRLIEPLLGGVYAGHARELSLAAALPALLPAYIHGTSLLAAARATRAALPEPGIQVAPVFAGLRGGVHRRPERLALRLRDRGVRIVTGVTAREIRHREGGGFEVVTGPLPDPSLIGVNRVIIATPPAAASRLLHQVAPAASSLLAGVQTASMAIVTMALPAIPGLLPSGSGVLVPPVEGMRVKAITFSSNKWGWVNDAAAAHTDGIILLRASLGRHRAEHELHRDDADLVAAVRADLETILGKAVPEAVDAHVQRWGGALPQYAVGHVERVAAFDQAIAGVPGLAVCGATYQGVGIPACIASGQAAAARVAQSQ